MSNDRDIASEAIEGMQEALRHAQGEKDLSTRTVEIEAEDIAAIRQGLEMTQAEFAELFGVNIHTLRNWEQGRRRPEGSAQTLLRVVKEEPEAVMRALHAA